MCIYEIKHLNKRNESNTLPFNINSKKFSHDAADRSKRFATSPHMEIVKPGTNSISSTRRFLLQGEQVQIDITVMDLLNP